MNANIYRKMAEIAKENTENKIKKDENTVDKPQDAPPQVNLLEVPINTEHDALNVIVGFLGMAQRRGSFAINESAKIYECIKKFQTNTDE